MSLFPKEKPMIVQPTPAFIVGHGELGFFAYDGLFRSDSQYKFDVVADARLSVDQLISRVLDQARIGEYPRALVVILPREGHPLTERYCVSGKHLRKGIFHPTLRRVYNINELTEENLENRIYIVHMPMIIVLGLVYPGNRRMSRDMKRFYHKLLPQLEPVLPEMVSMEQRADNEVVRAITWVSLNPNSPRAEIPESLVHLLDSVSPKWN
jgi:hypothetical protein